MHLPDVPEDLITTEHAARLAHLHVSGVRRLIFTGRVRGWRLGRRWHVSRAELLGLWQTSDEIAAAQQGRRLATRTEGRRRGRAIAEQLRERGIPV